MVVELGTGYFAEKTIPDARLLIERKLALIQKSIESVESVGNGKQKNLEMLTVIMNQKIQLMQNPALQGRQ